MLNSDLKLWLNELRPNLLSFLQRLEGQQVPGFYHFSLSGDLNQSETWGLGNSVYAAKILTMLGAVDPQKAVAIAHNIKRFQRKNGYIFDAYIRQCSRGPRLIKAVRKRYLDNILGEGTRRAETRQSFAALACLGERPKFPFTEIPYDPIRIRQFIYRLDWSQHGNWRQYGYAVNHLSDLLFFLRLNHRFFQVRDEMIDDLLLIAQDVAANFRQPNGAWFAPGVTISLSQQIEGAVKIITAYEAAGLGSVGREKELIDLSLSSISAGTIYDGFNIVCVLHHCQKSTDYRFSEIKEFCARQLALYRAYYWPELGGFSFYKGRSAYTYYDAKITQGLAEPDIYGSVLFLWSIVLISDIFGLRQALGFNIPDASFLGGVARHH